MPEDTPNGQSAKVLSRRAALTAAGLATAAGAAVVAACARTEPAGPAQTTTPDSGAPGVPETKPAQVSQPAAGITMTPGYASTIGQTAYVWGWPLVNMVNRRTSVTQAPHPGLLNGTLPIAPDAEQLHRPGADVRHLPQPGRCLRSPISPSTTSR